MQKIEELELAFKHNNVENVNTKILLILAENLNTYINFKTSYQYDQIVFKKL